MRSGRAPPCSTIRRMSYTAHKIVEHLFQGGIPPEGSFLADSGIHVLVLAAASWQEAAAYPGVHVICAPGDDDERRHRLDRFIECWRKAAEEVVEHVKAGKNVLVTCHAGQNRSGIISGMAVCMLTGLSGQEAVDLVSKRRPFALNNRTFAQYIIESFPGRTS